MYNSVLLFKRIKKQQDSDYPLDNLTYNYESNSNKLLNVFDNSNNNVAGFVDLNKSGDDYTYDLNGNMNSDKNKKITTIVYNHLNLPVKIIFGTAETIEYIYTATGQKVKKIVTQGGAITTTDYLGGFQYKNSMLQFFPHAEGYVKNTNGMYSYVYNYTDHLGNVRLSYSDADKNGTIANTTEIVEETHYYPFGLKHVGYVTLPITDNKYKYNGKEYQDELGLNLYDYGARMYDPAKGRWDVTDGKSELYYSSSSYAYASNTPVQAIDPDGNLVIFINGMHTGDGGKSDYWRNYTGKESNFMSMSNRQAFDIAVMNQLGDHNAIYRDGRSAITGVKGDIFGNDGDVFVSRQRSNSGYEQGKEDAKSIIANLARDKTTGEIVETIKIITHSMGAAYGKGYVKALKEYIKTLPKEMQYQVRITLVADFDPFQGGSLTADKNIKTQQFKHEGDGNIFGMGWLANENEQGLDAKKDVYTNTGTSTDHSIMTFFNDISKLSEGTYKWDGKNWVKQ